MKIIIQGQDYTAALDAVHPLTIMRRWAEPSVCTLSLSLPMSGSLAQPKRNQFISVDGDDGTGYFTGYIVATPMAEYSGLGMEGSRFRISIEAVSGDHLTNLAPDAVVHPSSPVLAPAVYRGSTGSLVNESTTGAVHDLDEGAGSLQDVAIAWNGTTRRMLANDVTVCGEVEPTDYVAEFLQGDGVTTQFFLTGKPYFRAAMQETIIDEPFTENTLDERNWSNTGSPGYLTLGSGGLSMQGGRGTDGTTMLTWTGLIEMGGTLLLETKGVSLQAGSVGILAAFFGGLSNQAGCVAGFKAMADVGSGAVTLQPIVNGSPAGSTYSVNSAYEYALRIRVHCSENQRVLSIFRAFDGTTLNSYGGQSNQSPAKLLFEIQEYVDGVAGMPVVLYDGTVADMPPTCSVAAASSINLQGSIRSIHLESLGSSWVTTTPSGGGAQSRRIGSVAQAAECQIDRAGTLTFFPGFTPAVNTLITVQYRATGRAVGRATNTAFQSDLTAAGFPKISAWQGTVTSPAARCSQDCRNAAQALVDSASDPGALWKGTCQVLRSSFSTDIQPGDAIRLNASSPGYGALVVAHNVVLSYRASYPDLIRYKIDFGNEWADTMAIDAGESLPTDVQLPAPVGITALPNLSGVSVTSMSGSTVTIDTGVVAPTGGGFEIRRRNNAFGVTETPDLVLRASTPTMSFTRTSPMDRFYIRTFDSTTPPNYSEFSAALIFNLPLGS
ncbi:MAG TPA: hypothetical protein VG844_09055 [Terracidiphilus sp.]|nr:hypothetical protein [Terracidiphilus sp.]